METVADLIGGAIVMIGVNICAAQVFFGAPVAA